MANPADPAFELEVSTIGRVDESWQQQRTSLRRRESCVTGRGRNNFFLGQPAQELGPVSTARVLKVFSLAATSICDPETVILDFAPK